MVKSSNVTEKNSNKNFLPHIYQGGEGEFECSISTFEFLYVISIIKYDDRLLLLQSVINTTIIVIIDICNNDN